MSPRPPSNPNHQTLSPPHSSGSRSSADPCRDRAARWSRSALRSRPGFRRAGTPIPAKVGYIIAGTVQMEIRDRPTLTLNAGDGFLIPPPVPHNALDLGPATGMMLSTYIVEVGQPIATVTS
jgi:hypothetical protein